MKVIPLTRGWVAWVDDDDYPGLAEKRWSVNVTNKGKIGYAVRAERGLPKGQRRVIAMQNEIMAPPEGYIVDHIERDDRDKVIDNRRSNLRLCTIIENRRNLRKVDKIGASAFKGITRSGQRWQTRIRVGPITVQLGCHGLETTAAVAYDYGALRLHGEFARTNFLGPHAIYASLPLSPNPDNSPDP